MTTAPRPVPARGATPADTDAIVDTFTTAFFHDPLWGPAFPDEQRRAEQAAVMWRVYVTAALRYPWTLVTPHAEAAAIWIPPGGVELTSQEADGLEERLAEATDSGTARAACDEIATAIGQVVTTMWRPAR